MFEAGIVDPAKVERVAMQNAVSVASLLLTTEATVTDIKEDKPCNASNAWYGWNGECQEWCNKSFKKSFF